MDEQGHETTPPTYNHVVTIDDVYQTFESKIIAAQLSTIAVSKNNEYDDTKLQTIIEQTKQQYPTAQFNITPDFLNRIIQITMNFKNSSKTYSIHLEPTSSNITITEFAAELKRRLNVTGITALYANPDDNYSTSVGEVLSVISSVQNDLTHDYDVSVGGGRNDVVLITVILGDYEEVLQKISNSQLTTLQVQNGQLDTTPLQILFEEINQTYPGVTYKVEWSPDNSFADIYYSLGYITYTWSFDVNNTPVIE